LEVAVTGCELRVTGRVLPERKTDGTYRTHRTYM